MEADKCVIKILKNKFLTFTYMEDTGKNLMQGRRTANKYFPHNGINWRRKCNPLQYPCLQNPMDRGSGQATVPGVAKSPPRLRKESTTTNVSKEGKEQIKANARNEELVLRVMSVLHKRDLVIHVTSFTKFQTGFFKSYLPARHFHK